jgi:hypothetical protein
MNLLLTQCHHLNCVGNVIEKEEKEDRERAEAERKFRLEREGKHIIILSSLHTITLLCHTL